MVIELIELEEGCVGKSVDSLDFTVKDIENSPSMVTSDPVQAIWKSSRYQDIAEFDGDLTITNEFPGLLLEDKTELIQTSIDFTVTNTYTLKFYPLNALPRISWISVDIPEQVEIDEATFVEKCSVVVMASLSGDKHCSLDIATRKVWLYDLFRDQDQFTSEIAIEFELSNPIDNFRDKSSPGSFF